jgi:two-component system OmpR family sensor kinase
VISGIRIETERMGRLVEDLLLLARLDEGRALERRRLELVSLAAEAIETARTVGPSWPVALEAARPVEVTGDRSALRQVLDNLLANVRAHTSPGTASRVTVRDEDGVAIVEVADKGPGFSEQEAERVLERFYRTDRSPSRRHGGVGLWLGIVAAIVAAHGGEVSASVIPGGGATFTIRVPFAPAVSDPAPDHR